MWPFAGHVGDLALFDLRLEARVIHGVMHNRHGRPARVSSDEIGYYFRGGYHVGDSDRAPRFARRQRPERVEVVLAEYDFSDRKLLKFGKHPVILGKDKDVISANGQALVAVERRDFAGKPVGPEALRVMDREGGDAITIELGDVGVDRPDSARGGRVVVDEVEDSR